jgi:hypothetical protein
MTVELLYFSAIGVRSVLGCTVGAEKVFNFCNFFLGDTLRALVFKLHVGCLCTSPPEIGSIRVGHTESYTGMRGPTKVLYQNGICFQKYLV